MKSFQICIGGLQRRSDGEYMPHTTEAAFNFSEQLRAYKPATYFYPYIGMELGQSWYALQYEFNTNSAHAHQWLRYKNGSVMTCDDTPKTHALCALLQQYQNYSKVYDWRAEGMIDFFVSNISGVFWESSFTNGIFFDDIYTICKSALISYFLSVLTGYCCG